MSKLTPAALRAGIDQAIADRVQYEYNWDVAHRFLTGQQETTRDALTRELLLTGDETLNRNLVFNLILPTYRNTMSMLDVSSPGIIVLPASNDSAEIIRSEASGLLARYYWQRLKMRRVIREATEWAAVAGTGGLHTFWDPNINKVQCRPVAPKDLAWPKGLKRWEDARWRAVRTTVDADSVIDAYPEKEKAIRDAAKGGRRAGDYTEENPENSVELWDVYVRDGRHVILCGDLTLVEEENGWDPTVTPISIIRYTPIPDRIWGIGLIGPIVHPQSVFNRIINNQLLNLDLNSHMKWVVSRDAGVDEGALRGGPGEIVWYDPGPGDRGGAPYPVTPTSIGNDVFVMLQQIERLREDIAGRHAPSMGRTSKGITSARQLEAVVAKDDTQLRLTQMSIEDACVEAARCMLVLSKWHMSTPQAVRMLDRSGWFVAKTLRATDLVDEPDIVIEAGTLFAEDAEDRRIKILELVGTGLMDFDEGMSEIAYGTSERFMHDRIRAMNHANDMLNGVVAGEGAFKLFETDDAVAFERAWRDYMNGDAFYRLPDEAKGRVLQAYEQILAMRRVQKGGIKTDVAMKNLQALQRGQTEQMKPAAAPPSNADKPPEDFGRPEPAPPTPQTGAPAPGPAPDAAPMAGGM